MGVLAAAAALLAAAPARAASKVSHVSLRDVAARYGLKTSAPGPKSLVLRSQWTQWTFQLNTREAICNGTVVWLQSPAAMPGGRWSIASGDLYRTLDPIMRPRSLLSAYRCRTIVLDPGHGGSDTGAISRNGRREKDLVLQIARRIRAALVNEGFRVVMTRDNDRTMDLEPRCAVAASARADLFLSLHINAAIDRSARGVETFALATAGYASTAGGARPTSASYTGNRHDHANLFLAYTIQRNLRTLTFQPDRGVRRARFLVLRNAPCPAALIEFGFLSNSTEERLMISETHQQRIADAVAQAVKSYAQTVKAAAGP